jgi:hypothetical protein
MNILDKLKINHRPSAGALDLLKYRFYRSGELGYQSGCRLRIRLCLALGCHIFFHHADHHPA